MANLATPYLFDKRFMASYGLAWPRMANLATPYLFDKRFLASHGLAWPRMANLATPYLFDMRFLASHGLARPRMARNWSASLAEVRRPKQNSQQHNFVQAYILESPMKRDAHLITVPARAIDVGYANTKFTCGHKVARGVPIIHTDLFPSITATLRAGAPFRHAPGTLGADGGISEIDGVQHFAGRGVEMHLKGLQPRHVMKDYCTSPAYLALMRGAMHYMLVDEGNPKEMTIEHLTVGLPLNTFDEYEDHLRELAIGRHSVISRDPAVGERHVTVLDASVIVQPLGALYYYGLTHKDFEMSGWNLVVDVGGGTIDFLAAYDKVPNYERSGAHPESMLACAYEVAKAINPELKNQYGVIQAIDLAIRDNRETVRIGGEDYEMARYKGAINEVLRRGYEAMLNTVGALNDFDNILVCGGGGAVFFEFLREHAPELRRRLKMDGGSTFSNVRGFQVAADYAAKEASANR